MSEQTEIQWCDSTVNFLSGCTKVSEGCAHCYAEALSNRGLGKKTPQGRTIGMWGKGAPRKLHESAFNVALKLNRKPWICDGCGKGYASTVDANNCCPASVSGGEIHRRRIFSLSLGDWLDPEVPIGWMALMLNTIRQCDQVVWILCTKRPELWWPRLNDVLDWRSATGEGDLPEEFFKWLELWLRGKAPQHIWLLASVENQKAADVRIPQLLNIPAVVHGLSMEPLLGPVVILEEYLCQDENCSHARLNWLIVGGESGKLARPCDTNWIRNIVQQGKDARVATFVKQLGSRPYQSPERDGATGYEITIKHPKGGEPAEWPAGLHVREFPNATELSHSPVSRGSQKEKNQ